MSAASTKKSKAKAVELLNLTNAFNEIERNLDDLVSTIEEKSQKLETCASGFNCDLSMVRKPRSENGKVVQIHAKGRR